MMLIDPFRFRGSGPVECDFRTFTLPTSTGTSHTIADQDIGDPYAGRHVFCAVHWYSDGLAPGSVILLTAEIGGVEAAIHGQKSTGNPNITLEESGVALFSARLDAGASATIDLSFNSIVSVGGLASWRVINLISQTPIDVAAIESPENPMDTSCDVAKDGVALLAGICFRTGTPTATGVTQDYGVERIGVGGSYEVVADEVSRLFTTQFGDPVVAGAPIHASVVASFR